MCGERPDFGYMRIATFTLLSLSTTLIFIGLATPGWTEEGGGYWAVKHHIPLLLTASRTLVLSSCLGLVLAEVVYLGSTVWDDLSRRLAVQIEAGILFLCGFCMLLGLILFTFYSQDENLGAFGYSYYMTCVGAGFILVANMTSILDMGIKGEEELRLLTH